MEQRIIEFLTKYQLMRAEQITYFKTRNKATMIKAKQLELDLDKEAAQLKAALEVK